jgi:hypothetical protein
MTFSASLTLAALLVCGLCHGAETKLQPSKDDVKNELTGVIESQLAAFRTNDFAKAYTFAASGIQKQFNREQFEQMVRRGYPVIAESKSAKFGITLDDGGQAVVKVVIEGKAGKALRFAYFLVREDGKWRINGVVEKPPEGEEA